MLSALAQLLLFMHPHGKYYGHLDPHGQEPQGSTSTDLDNKGSGLLGWAVLIYNIERLF